MCAFLVDFQETLKSMRMTIPFSGRAKFTGICTVHDLYISDVIHQVREGERERERERERGEVSSAYVRCSSHT